MLARSVARRTQTAVRLAVGATQMQIVGQALYTSCSLSPAASPACGRHRFAQPPRAGILNTVPADQHTAIAPGPGVRLALLTGIIFGAAPPG
jgi:hypothetical protein